MVHMAAMEMAAWLDHYFPAITFSGWSEDACWLGLMKTRQSEHNPPFYWLGRALDAIAEAGAGEAYGRRLVAAHGAEPCGAAADRDQRAQDVLSEACAFAWAVAHLGPPRFEAAAAGAALDQGPVRLYVPAHDVYVAPARLRAQRSMEQVIGAIAAEAARAAVTLPPARGRILYLDTWHEPRYAQNVGYRLELTEPVQEALRHHAGEAHLGHVFSRPFQWGNPIEAQY